MAIKFLYITTDPFINNSEEFVRILAISNFVTFPSSGGATSMGNLLDPNGNPVAAFQLQSSGVFTEATAYPYAFSEGWNTDQIIIIPPGWQFKNFGRAIAVQGSLEEVLRVH
jgi:chitinase